tara:strand:- start:155 stop:496 length:342 start_codon:yes stop_codon:yes gene_type:complete
MCYKIDIIFDLRKNPNISAISNKIIDIGYNNNCIQYYKDYEFSGKFRNIIKQNTVLCFFFKYNDIINFIKKIKELKSVRISSITRDNTIILPKTIHSKINKITELDKNILNLL